MFRFGAYWEPRPVQFSDCARRLSGLLSTLSEMHSLFDSWYLTGNSISEALARGPIELDQESISRVAPALSETQPEFRLWLWNGRDPEGVGLSTYCGSSSPGTNFKNNFVLTLPSMAEGGAELHEAGLVHEVMDAVVDCWRPEWAMFVSNELRNAQDLTDPTRAVGWLTYIDQRIETTSLRLPKNVRVIPRGTGSLFQIGPDPLTVRAEDTITVQQELLRILT